MLYTPTQTDLQQSLVLIKIQVQRTLKVMRDMEELGLQELTSISQDQQSHFQNNKNAINGQYARAYWRMQQ